MFSATWLGFASFKCRLDCLSSGCGMLFSSCGFAQLSLPAFCLRDDSAFPDGKQATRQRLSECYDLLCPQLDEELD